MIENSQDPAPNTRREFLFLAAGAAVGCGCESINKPRGAATGSGQPRGYDVGPVATFAGDGVYSNFRDMGFFIIRNGGTLTALSSVCTHRRCKLKAEDDHSFSCHCHGSTFDPSGHVTEGPAKRDLPVFPTSTDGNGHLIVTVLT